MPLADQPEIQQATLLKLGVDTRTPEQRLVEDFNEESKEPVI